MCCRRTASPWTPHPARHGCWPPTCARRFAFNWGLALVKERLEARARGEDVEVPWTLAALRREWNRQKHRVAPWWRENSKEAYASGLDGLARALQNWSKSRQGERKAAG